MGINRGIILSMGYALLMQTLAVWTSQQAFPVADRTEKTLHEAARGGDIEAVQALLGAGADVNVLDRNKLTPLHCAVREGHVGVVRVLLKAGTAVDAGDGWTPLHEAAEAGQVAIAQLLINNGANVNAVDSLGETPLHQVAIEGCGAIARLLIGAGANVDAADTNGSTPLHMVAETGRVGVARALLEAGADVSVVNCEGQTALGKAKECDHGTVARMLQGAQRLVLLPRQRENDRLPRNLFASSLAKAKSLATATGKRHYPIIFLIDQEESGGVCLKKQGDSIFEVSVQPREALFRHLLMQVALNNKLMVVSKGLAYGLIALAHERGDYAVAKRAIKDRWAIYNVPETQFTIWLPHDYTDFYADILKLSSLEKLSTSARSEILHYCPSAYVLDDDARVTELQRQYHEHDLAKIFDLEKISRDKHAICDVWLDGHGMSGVSVAGLPVSKNKPEAERITSLLSFFNDKLNTGVVCVGSCYAGGQNATLMQTRKDGSLVAYNYAFILYSITDRVIRMRAPKMVSWVNTFFDFALRFSEDGCSALEGFTKRIVPELRIPDFEGDPRGYAAFPQVWLAGGLEYQARRASSDVHMVGRVLARVAAEQKRSIELKGRQMALWYPKVVNGPVTVSPARININASKLPRERFGRALITVEERINAGDVDCMLAEYPALYALLLHTRSGDALQRWITQARTHLYPEFMLMGGTAHRRVWLKKVVVEDGGNPLMGILRFLRDSFAYANRGSAEQKDILIGSLEGTNDVPFHMEMTFFWGDPPATPLYEKLCVTAGQKITLKNVMVRINAPEHLGKIAFYVPFDGQWWLYTVPLKRSNYSVRAWDFQPTTAPPAIEAFKKALDAHVVPVGRIATKFGGTNSTASRLLEGP